MQLQSRSYWASRIDTENQSYFWSELQPGTFAKAGVMNKAKISA